MRRILFTLLLCLGFVANLLQPVRGDSPTFIRVIVKPDSQDSSATHRVHSLNGSGDLRRVSQGIPFGAGVVKQASAPGLFVPPPPMAASPCKPIAKCKASRMRVGTYGAGCGPPRCGPICPTCILPRRMPGQWEASTQVFFARVRGTAHWSNGASGLDPSEVDFNDDLGVDEHDVFLEYSGRYQLRPSWSLYYSAMPIEMKATNTPNESFTFGAWTFSAGAPTRSKWQFLYQRVGLFYHPINTPMTVVSLGASWLFNDERLRVSSAICNGRGNTLDRTRHMVMGTVEVQKCIVTLPNASTFSSDNRIGLGFLDDTFALDLQVGFQYSVPMNAGRWGFARGGYRLIDFKEDRNDLRLDTALEGGYVEFGLIF